MTMMNGLWDTLKTLSNENGEIVPHFHLHSKT